MSQAPSHLPTVTPWAGPMPPAGGAPHGDFGEDPVIAAARAMGG